MNKPNLTLEETLPRTGENADKPGCYELMIRSSSSVINPGDEVRLLVFVTGYGSINNPKLVFYPPLDFIRSGSVFHGLKTEIEQNKMYIRGWGSEKSTIETQGFTLILRGPKYKGSGRRGTMFFDWPPNNEGCYLMTEQLDGDRKTAPFTFSLETTPSVRIVVASFDHCNRREGARE